MRKILSTVVTMILCLGCVAAVQSAPDDDVASGHTPSISGKIILGDSLAGGSASVMLPELNISAITRIDGSYEIDNIPEGRHAVRYSFLGYKTITDTLDFRRGVHLLKNVRLMEYSIPLTTVYITPKNQDPATFILGKLQTTAAANKSRLKGYSVNCEGTYSIKNADKLSEMMDLVLTGFQKKIVRMALSLMGIKKMFDLFTRYPELKFKATMPCQYSNGSFKKGTLAIQSPQLSDDDKATLKKHFSASEVFQSIYGNDCLWSKKKSKKNEWTFAGSYDEDNKTIDKLICKTAKGTTTLHVVDGEWGILKIEEQDKNTYSVRECREVADGLYLPVSRKSQLKSNLLQAKDMKELKEYINNPDKKATKDMEMFESLKKRMAKDPKLAAHVNQKLDEWEQTGMPIETMSSSVMRYSQIVVK